MAQLKQLIANIGMKKKWWSNLGKISGAAFLLTLFSFNIKAYLLD
jgi:hypothetical protein